MNKNSNLIPLLTHSVENGNLVLVKENEYLFLLHNKDIVQYLFSLVPLHILLK